MIRTSVDTAWIGERVRALGFELCGVAPAEKFPELADAQEWFARGFAGEMKYLGDARRCDPARVLAGSRSVIVCGMNYSSALPKSIEFDGENGSTMGAEEDGEPRGWISRYAWGDDYHDVLRSRLNVLVTEMRERFGGAFEALAYADTGPLQERIFAKHAGIGWIGKNTLVLNQQMGSWFFLGVVLTTLELTPSLRADEAPTDLCGTCTRCIEACPTDALIAPYEMDARRCISYLTIEHRGEIPEEFREAIGNHVYGCDICQDVCPWNRRAPTTSLTEFEPRAFDGKVGSELTSLFRPKLTALAAINEDDYKTVFRGSAIKRTKHRGIVRNACIALGNARFERGGSAHREVLAVLQKLSASNDPVIAESALWALSRIQ
ncbi:MAG: tRNA epoxyqueuosine(34) reductase QueG [Acidobacteria bacterium]|nr:tRNA epoxyqueuosine(34) reductase QueG [Acidobacteriota bacterium]